uniref:Uncharacterized protein n=1 Tax=Mycena chlorophos TaxID=658473 RepID=A0ABQ0LVG8_MYCCL|nr:predicted protein [Mycena chlorophos]
MSSGSRGMRVSDLTIFVSDHRDLDQQPPHSVTLFLWNHTAYFVGSTTARVYNSRSAGRRHGRPMDPSALTASRGHIKLLAQDPRASSTNKLALQSNCQLQRRPSPSGSNNILCRSTPVTSPIASGFFLGCRNPFCPALGVQSSIAEHTSGFPPWWESYSGRSSTSTSSSEHLVAPRGKSARRDAPPSKVPAVPPKPARRDSKSRRPRKAVKSGLHVEIPRRSSSRKSTVAITYTTNVVATHGSDRFVNNILAVPFIRSDPAHPSAGVVIVVEQFQVVSEPEPTPVRRTQPKPSDCSEGRALATDPVLPEQPGKIAEPFRDKAPAGSDLVSPQVAEPPERSSEPPLPPLPVENPHVARLRNGAKRRKHYSPQYPTRSTSLPVP